MNTILRMNLPWVESPFFEAELAERAPHPERAALARHFHENGYAVLRGVVPEALANRVRDEVKALFRPDAAEGPRSAYRAQDGWRESPEVRALAAHPAILATLEFLYDRKPIPFQTLNFLRGSQQRAHCDAIHFSSIPPRFMCGAWAALEDITPDNGPLFYYPGSHKLPEYNYYDMGMSVKRQDYRRYEDFIEALMKAHGFRKETLSARKGDVLIWASNLVHGGEPIRIQDSTRWSQVTHYYFNDCVYLTPMRSNYLTGEIYYREIRDIGTGKMAPQTYNGTRYSAVPHGIDRYRLVEGWHPLAWTISKARRALSGIRYRFSKGGDREMESYG